MALPRSTVPGAVTKSTGMRVPVAVPAVGFGTSATATVTVPSRKFAVGEQTVAWFDIQENGAGLIIDGVGPVLGNKPNYTVVLSFYNPAGSGTVGAATRNIWIAQE